MPEIRQNIATKEWVIISPERAKRPEDFKAPPKARRPSEERVDSCPFCPGNEESTATEVGAVRDGQGRWQVRVVANKYPALSRDGELVHHHEREARRWMSGVGLHDVVIETPAHNLTTALLPPEQVLRILRCYRERYAAAVEDPRVELVTLFKNHGAGAGTSLEHPHSQMIAGPVVPASIRNRVGEAMRYYDDHRQCVFCCMAEDEIRSGERIVVQTEHFVGFVLWAALSPFHIWVMPRRHHSSYLQITDEEMADLARALKELLGRIHVGLQDPDFNYVIRSLPGPPRPNAFFHWYMSLIPRVSQAAGFELGSGMFVNSALPERSAEFLRSVRL